MFKSGLTTRNLTKNKSTFFFWQNNNRLSNYKPPTETFFKPFFRKLDPFTRQLLGLVASRLPASVTVFSALPTPFDDFFFSSFFSLWLHKPEPRISTIGISTRTQTLFTKETVMPFSSNLKMLSGSRHLRLNSRSITLLPLLPLSPDSLDVLGNAKTNEII